MEGQLGSFYMASLDLQLLIDRISQESDARTSTSIHSNDGTGVPTTIISTNVNTETSMGLRDAYRRDNVIVERAFSKFRAIMLIDPEVRDMLPATFPALSPALENIYRISSAGKKGLGMFAIQDIPVGGSIVVENPALVIKATCDMPSEVYRRVFDACDPFLRENLLRLAKEKSVDFYGMEEGIVSTNAILIRLGVPVEWAKFNELHYGVFPTISRCNHR